MKGLFGSVITTLGLSGVASGAGMTGGVAVMSSLSVERMPRGIRSGDLRLKRRRKMLRSVLVIVAFDCGLTLRMEVEVEAWLARCSLRLASGLLVETEMRCGARGLVFIPFLTCP